MYKEKPKSKKFVDISGNTYGRLFVLGYGGKIKGTHYWYCKCECGNSKPFKTSSSNLKRGKSKSCGCIKKERKSTIFKNESDFIKYVKELCNKTTYTFLGYDHYSGTDTRLKLKCLSCESHREVVYKSLKQGRKCKICSDKEKGLSYRKGLGYFLDKIKKAHEGKDYDLSLIKDEVCVKDIVEVICPYHGVFKASVDNLCQGKGCPRCKLDKFGKWNLPFVKRNMEKSKKDFCSFYVLKDENSDLYKLGITKDIDSRLKILKRVSGLDLTIFTLHNSSLYESVVIENYFKNVFKHKNNTFKDRKFGGYTEFYKLYKKDVDYLKEIIDYLSTNKKIEEEG